MRHILGELAPEYLQPLNPNISRLGETARSLVESTLKNTISDWLCFDLTQGQHPSTATHRYGTWHGPKLSLTQTIIEVTY